MQAPADTPSTPSVESTDWRVYLWPAGIVAFFVVLISVNMVMIYLSVQVWEDPLPSYADNPNR